MQLIINTSHCCELKVVPNETVLTNISLSCHILFWPYLRYLSRYRNHVWSRLLIQIISKGLYVYKNISHQIFLFTSWVIKFMSLIFSNCPSCTVRHVQASSLVCAFIIKKLKRKRSPGNWRGNQLKISAKSNEMKIHKIRFQNRQTDNRAMQPELRSAMTLDAAGR